MILSKLNLLLLFSGLIGVASNFVGNLMLYTTYKYQIVSVVSGTPYKMEVVLTDISSMQQGTLPGQYSCLSPFVNKCTVIVNSSFPDGYLDSPLNLRPYYFSNSVKVVVIQGGTFTLN